MMEQRTPEWFAARCGKVTASRLADVMARTKSGYAASRQNYMAELICQRLTGKLEEGFSNAAMIRGTELEPVAREMYALNEFDAEITEVGLSIPTMPGFAASPDGLVVNGDGLIEIRSAPTRTHLETLKLARQNASTCAEYAQMMCTGARMIVISLVSTIVYRQTSPISKAHSLRRSTGKMRFSQVKSSWKSWRKDFQHKTDHAA